jgi:hypothetical protein
MTAERRRLEEATRREKHWRRWGPYLSEREWGTVREDYSANGDAWGYFPFEHAHQRAYRWGEDGIAGISDNHQRLCFAIALWNGRDPILKERLFGLAGPDGNHGEDVKEVYYYLDSTPTHSYLKHLYKYPQAEFPYHELARVNDRRTRLEPEYEILDTGVFKEERYFDVFTEYAKADVDDIRIRITVVNRGPDPATLHLLPTLWFRNTWSWYLEPHKPGISKISDTLLEAHHDTLGTFCLRLAEPAPFLFTENDTNNKAVFGAENNGLYTKDAFHRYLIHGEQNAVNPEQKGTKACAVYQLDLQSSESRTVELHLFRKGVHHSHDSASVFKKRISEADEFYCFHPADLSEDARNVQRQAFAGMLWSKQYYHLVIEEWLKGDPAQPPPPESRKQGRNSSWIQLFNADIISMPDKWEYPWYAAWDLAFHMIPFALIDPEFAKSQLALFLREWYMHPNGQIPAYEWSFSDVNPPVHAWACWRVYKIDAKLQGVKDTSFLERVFHKLLMNFTWWVNRKDSLGNNIFEGGFLGLDNIGVFDRSAPLPTGGILEQSDATSWMAMYCLNMLRIALELSETNHVYEDIASKFFEHFLYISASMNYMDGGGLWDEQDGFYYDRLRLSQGDSFPMRVRSLVGLCPIFAVETLEPEVLDKAPGFVRRMQWFIHNRPDLCRNIASMTVKGKHERRLLSLLPKDRLVRVLSRMLDENEFLSPHGIRGLSKFHKDHPYSLTVDGREYRVDYEPAESQTMLFGGNSNWRGPVWFPVNYLLIESLQRFHHYFGEEFTVEFPTGSGRQLHLSEVAAEISRRLSHIFLKDENGRRAVFNNYEKMQTDPNFRDYLLFYEYFHGETAAGLGAGHQTGWTGLVAKLLQQSGE